MREGGHPRAFRLPHNATLKEFRERLLRLKTPPGGLPEEHLFYPPDIPRNGQPPWDTPPQRIPRDGIDWRPLTRFEIWKYLDEDLLAVLLPWLFSKNWWMYQHDQRHTGHNSGASDIHSTNVCHMYLHKTVTVDGPVVTKPSIVDGKVYVGSGKSGQQRGTLHKSTSIQAPSSSRCQRPAARFIAGCPASAAHQRLLTIASTSPACMARCTALTPQRSRRSGR